MSQLTALKSAKGLHDLAKILGFRASGLSYVLYIQGDEAKYRTFTIPKRRGGLRAISAPNEALSLLQKRLADLLQHCVDELKEANRHKDQCTHGFVPGRSIVTNGRMHRSRRFVFNIDLENFFGSINFGRVRGFFIKDERFQLDAKVATLIAQIACFKDCLPQGSPCSPVISNLIGHVLDVHLVRLAKENGCTYTRYADDISFSTNQKAFPESIATQDPASSHVWQAGSRLSRIIERSGFSISATKTRMQYRDSRQEVTGLVVNRKTNVPKEYRHTVRAMVHRLFTTGAFIGPDGSLGTTAQLRGMLGFIYRIDKTNHEFAGLSDGDAFPRESAYKRFLMYSEFYAAPKPVLVCEGKTDYVYMLHAIHCLEHAFPSLITKENGKTSLAIRLFKSTGNSTGGILGLTGGVTHLAKFIRAYQSNAKSFKAPGLAQPVIILVDNDDGMKAISGAMKSILKKAYPAFPPPYYFLGSNLYVVPTPLSDGATKTAIESFFDKATKETKIDGKSFDPECKEDTGSHYGKTVFAHKVVRSNADKIDFSGFAPLLKILEQVIHDHAKKAP
jgi:RNA-directed DNA polymerase